VVAPPTCTGEGYTTYTCTTCGENFADNHVSATGHSYTLNDNHTCDICKYSKTPGQPVVENKTHHSVTLVQSNGFEYSKDGIVWQSSNVFVDLSADTTYTFYQRVKASATTLVSEVSAVLTVKTDEESVYTIVFKDWDGTVLSTKTYHYGDTVDIPTNPTRPGDSTYTYTFAGWDNAVVNCAGDATYTANYTSAYIEYTVVFKNWDGTVLSAKTYHYGDKVSIPANPTKAANEIYRYEFTGWDKAVTTVTGDAEYTANYTPVYISYTVVFRNYDGSILSEQFCHYGDPINIPENPTRYTDETYTYVFAGWDREVTKCYGDEVYTATYTSSYRDYGITFIIVAVIVAMGGITAFVVIKKKK
jgi:ribosomal protein L21E